MKPPDNTTYQFQVELMGNVAPAGLANRLLGKLVGGSQMFQHVRADESNKDLTILYRGSGPQEDPMAETHVGPTGLMFWLGWNWDPEQARVLRRAVLEEMGSALGDLSPEFIKNVSAFYTVTVPLLDLKDASEVPEFQRHLDLSHVPERFVPQISVWQSFTNVEGNETLTWLAAPSLGTPNALFTATLSNSKIVVRDTGLGEALKAHAADAEEQFDHFLRYVLGPLLKTTA